MKFICEIGLNHLGKDSEAISIAKSLSKKKIAGVTIQILPNYYYDNKKNYKRKLKIQTLEKIASILKNKKIKLGYALYDFSGYSRIEKLPHQFIKILSPGAFNLKLIKHISKRKKKIFVSTGAINFKDMIGIKKISKNIEFIHTSLDHDTELANLSAISKMRNKLKKNISFGMHSKNLNVLLLSSQYKPEFIFFYIKPNKIQNYPDNLHAIQLSKINMILKELNNLKSASGNGIKKRSKIPDWVFE